jgi:hypothetical protein
VSFRTYIRVLAVLTGAVYLALLWTGAVALMPQAGGQWPFDLRATGYSPDEAAAFLAVLTDAGRVAYLGPVAMWDTVFPPLLALLLASLIWRWRRPLLAPVPFLYAAVDLWENAVIGRMVATGDTSLAASASNLTQAKYALLVMALGLVWRSWRERRQ